MTLSATVENEAIATVENEATQTDWMGDLGGGLGVDLAACRGRCSAAASRKAVGDRVDDGRSGVGFGSAAEFPLAPLTPMGRKLTLVEG